MTQMLYIPHGHVPEDPDLRFGCRSTGGKLHEPLVQSMHLSVGQLDLQITKHTISRAKMGWNVSEGQSTWVPERPRFRMGERQT